MKVWMIDWELNETGDIYQGHEETVYTSKKRAEEECKKLNEGPQENIKFWVTEAWLDKGK